MRELSRLEQANATYLAGRDIEFSFLLLTATGLRKSIMDAIAPLREFKNIAVFQCAGNHQPVSNCKYGGRPDKSGTTNPDKWVKGS